MPWQDSRILSKLSGEPSMIGCPGATGWDRVEDTRGTHLLVELWGCDSRISDDPKKLAVLMRQAVRASGATFLNAAYKKFAPVGVSGVVTISESHLAIHTWPQKGYAALDVYTCGQRCKPLAAVDVVRKGLHATKSQVIEVVRGVDSGIRVLHDDPSSTNRV